MLNCKTCDGTGKIRCPECGGNNAIRFDSCNCCHGDGWITCPACGGSGKQED